LWTRHLSKLDLDCDGFEVETVMNVRAVKAGLSIQEIPSHEHSRMYGESNLRIVRDGIRIAKFILRERFPGRSDSRRAEARDRAVEMTPPALTSPQPAETVLDRI